MIKQILRVWRTKFWTKLLTLFCGLAVSLVAIQRLSIIVEVSNLPEDVLPLDISAVESSSWGSGVLNFNGRSAPSPVEFIFDLSEAEFTGKEIADAVIIRTEDGATPKVQGARMEGMTATWHSSLPDIRVAINPDSKIDRMMIKRSGSKPIEVFVDHQSREVTSIQSYSSRRIFYSWTAFRSGKVVFGNDIQTSGTVDRFRAIWGGLTVVEIRSGQPLSGFSATIDRTQLGSVILTGLLSLAVFLLKIVFLAACFVLAGLPIARAIGDRTNIIETATVAFISGVSIGLCTTVTLSFYGLSLGRAATVFWIGSGIVVLCWFAKELALNDFTGTKAGFINVLRRGEFFPLIIISLVCTTLQFAPEALYPGSFLGHNNTDTYWYLNVASDLNNMPPKDFSPNLWMLHRIGDVASIVLVQWILVEPVLSAYTKLGAVLMLALPWLVYVISIRISRHFDLSLSAALLAGSSAAVISQFTQSYLSQYLMTHLLVFGLAFGLIILQDWAEAMLIKKVVLIVVFGAVLGAGIDVYPYIQVIPVAFVSSLFLCSANRPKTNFMITLALGGFTMLWSNESLHTIINFGDNYEYLGTLNVIGKYFVFPFYDKLEMFARSLGLKDWNMNSQYLSDILDLFGLNVLSPGPFWAQLIEAALEVTGILLFFCWVRFVVRSLLRRQDAALLGVAFLSLGIMSLILFNFQQEYLYAKILFSLGSLLSCFHLLLFRYSSYAWKTVGVLCIVTNFFVYSLDIAPLYLGSMAKTRIQFRSHYDVIDNDLYTLSRIVARNIEGMPEVVDVESVVVVGRWDGWVGTEKDRLSIWYLREVFAPYKIVFTEEISPGGGLWYRYGVGINPNRLMKEILMGKVKLILVCPGYQLPEGVGEMFKLESSNSVGSLYKYNPRSYAEVRAM